MVDHGHGHRLGAGPSVRVRHLRAVGDALELELEAVEGGTRVTESMLKPDKQVLPIRILQRLVGVPDRVACVREGMETTLDNLATAVR